MIGVSGAQSRMCRVRGEGARRHRDMPATRALIAINRHTCATRDRRGRALVAEQQPEVLPGSPCPKPIRDPTNGLETLFLALQLAVFAEVASIEWQGLANVAALPDSPPTEAACCVQRLFSRSLCFSS